MMSKNEMYKIAWDYPSPETHAGMPLSNGTLGALVWGTEHELKITINRADFWDHRGGWDFENKVTYESLQTWLKNKDEESIKAAFQQESLPSLPDRPSRMPLGRIDIQFPPEFRLIKGTLNLLKGECVITVQTPDSRFRIRIAILHDIPVLALMMEEDQPCTITPVPAYEEGEVRTYYEKYDIKAPAMIHDDVYFGWVQSLPSDPTISVISRTVIRDIHKELYIACTYGKNAGEAVMNAVDLLEQVNPDGYGYKKVLQDTRNWWSQYWDHAPYIELPDPDMEKLYRMGLYKLAGMSKPGGPAATLQGPWVEEYRMPPWSSDYHFNINVQECYWPAFAGNQLQTLEPLFQMVRSWEVKLAKNAKDFMGISDGFQLPHAVDDRCTCMGGFWTGSIDHGSTAWTGQLMWQYYAYTLDQNFLETVAYPFLKGAFRVYDEMLEYDGSQYSLPVSVSPEFKGCDMDAWGRNATFQLVNIHFLCKVLLLASQILNKDQDDRQHWQEIMNRLPIASIGQGRFGTEILLWENQPLTESHRHMSHLAGLYPFDVLDYYGNDTDKEWVDHSLENLAYRGMSAWTGWCLPWAAILYARTGNGDMAELLLQIFRRAFLRYGGGSTHDAQFKGLTLFHENPQIMQAEAALGASAAIMEMLVFTAAGVLHICPAIPWIWQKVSFENILAEGGVLVSARREKGKVVWVSLTALQGITIHLWNPFERKVCKLVRQRDVVLLEGKDILEILLVKGDTVELLACN